MKAHKVFTAVTLAIAASAAGAACLTDAQVDEMARQYAAKAPATNPPALSEEDAACTRAKFNVLLEKQYGRVIGYKAGLTNPAVQKRFGYDKPVWGKLYQGMVLNDGATVDATFGARPRWGTTNCLLS